MAKAISPLLNVGRKTWSSFEKAKKKVKKHTHTKTVWSQELCATSASEKSVVGSQVKKFYHFKWSTQFLIFVFVVKYDLKNSWVERLSIVCTCIDVHSIVLSSFVMFQHSFNHFLSIWRSLRRRFGKNFLVFLHLRMSFVSFLFSKESFTEYKIPS